MTGIEGLAGRFQPDPLAGADNQCTHDGPVITESKVSTDYNLGGDGAISADLWDYFVLAEQNQGQIIQVSR
jgi:hypothetical protein